MDLEFEKKPFTLRAMQSPKADRHGIFRRLYPCMIWHSVRAAAALNALVFLFGASGAEPVASDADLRGYGKVSARFAPGRAEFICESSDKAEMLQGKLLADLFWQATEKQRAGRTIDVGGIKAIVHDFPPFGAIVVCRLGARVLALGGSDEAELAGIARKEEMFRDSRCAFKADRDYPVYLDFFDLSAVKMYTYAMQSSRGEGLGSHWPFLRKFGLNGIAYSLGGGMLMAKSPARGILNFVDTDFEVREAESNRGMIVPAISTGGGLPTWAANLFPESVIRQSPTGIGADEFVLPLLESFGMPRNEREITGLWGLRETMHRYGASPAIGGYKLYDGPAGSEMAHGYQETFDFSKSGLESFREFLRNVKGFDLRTLGLRYYNDPGHFQAWDQVMPLDANAFFGNLDDSCLLLTRWQWAPCPVTDSTATEPPSGSGLNWQQITFPGSDQMLTVPEADAFYRITFDARKWVEKNPGKDFFLITGRMRAKKPAMMKIWLNGKFLGDQGRWDSLSKSRSVAVKVTQILKPGVNELQLWIPKGKLLSPFFLTTHIAEEYPSSDRTLNARYVDLKDWQYSRLAIRHRDMIELARGIEPNRPLMLTAGGAWEMADDIVDIATKMGASVQNTGREANQPWWPRLGRVAGFYGSSEPGATVTPDSTKPMSLNWLFGTILIDGDSAHTLYWQLEDYIGIERTTGWFTKNKRLLSLVGKSLAIAPEIVIFRSSQTMRYSPEHWGSAPFRWDIGRGELNGAHYNWGYITEGGVRRGLPSTCKVLFDSGSEIMESATVDAIASFVSRGGIFVALHNTGRHDPIEADTWPVARLTGCKVIGRKANGKIRFESDLPVFKGWEGREFDGEGIALDWTGTDRAKDQSLRLSPQSGEVKVLAKWADGTAAVTSRTLGKGRVICLGSTFWRNARDKGGAWHTDEDRLDVLERLFTDLGVERTSDASSPNVWVNESITKNGLESWLVAFNSSLTPGAADVGFRADAKPSEVRELTSGRSVPFLYSDGWVHLKGIDFASSETKVFSIKRADLANGLPFWWAEKTKYWKKAVVPVVADEPRESGKLGSLKIDSWKFLADRDGKVSAAGDWSAPQFNDNSWGAIETGPWNSLREELKDYAGTGLYRKAFSLPAEWKGSSISLNLYGDRAPKIFGSAEFFLNGKRVEGAQFQRDLGSPGYPARFVVDNLLAGKDNVLAVKIEGGGKVAGESFSGFGGSVYLVAQRPLAPVLDLGGEWTLVRQDGSSSPVSFPVAGVAGKYIAKNFDIPMAWAGREIVLRVETETPWLEGIMINGRLLVAPAYRRLGRYVEWKVTPSVQPGKRARVELWSKALPLFAPYDPRSVPPDKAMDLLSAKIGCAQ